MLRLAFLLLALVAAMTFAAAIVEERIGAALLAGVGFLYFWNRVLG